MKSIGNFLKTLIPVMLGVYIAIAAENCNEEHQSGQKIEKIVNAIKEEVLQNQKDIKIKLKYHREFKDTMDAYLSNFSEEELYSNSIRGLTQLWNGTRMGKLKHGAYQAGINSGLMTEMDMNLLTLITNLYMSQENYDRLGVHYLNRVGQIGSNSTLLDGVITFQPLSYDAIYAEEELFVEMDTLLTVINDFLKD